MQLFVDTVNGFVTNAGGVVTTVTYGGNDSNTLRKAADIRLLSPMVLSQTAGYFRLFSGKMHDQTYGINVRHQAANVLPLLDKAWHQMYSGDIITFQLSGTAGAGKIDTAVLPLVYINPDGNSAGNYIDPATLAARRLNDQIATVELAITAGVAGGYSGSLALNAAANLQKLVGNTKYALLGLQSDVELIATITGPDTANYRYAMCASKSEKHITGRWTVDQSIKYGLPLIPVIDTANIGTTNIEVVNNDLAAAPHINLILQRLAS